MTYALYDLCQHKEYLEPLRAEMQSVEFEKLSRTSQGMPLLDSFIKESTRLSPMEASELYSPRRVSFSLGRCL